MLAAKMEKLQYKVIMTPRYVAQLSQEQFSTAVTRKNTLLIEQKTKWNRKFSFQLASERPFFADPQGDGG